MVSRNYIPGASRQFREAPHTPWQPADEPAVSHWRGDAVGRQSISTAQPSPQLPAWKSGGGASRYYDTNLRLRIWGSWVNCIGRRTIMCMLLIAALAIILPSFIDAAAPIQDSW